jgi:predicted type IV restriction endonuclease
MPWSLYAVGVSYATSRNRMIFSLFKRSKVGTLQARKGERATVYAVSEGITAT